MFLCTSGLADRKAPRVVEDSGAKSAAARSQLDRPGRSYGIRSAQDWSSTADTEVEVPYPGANVDKESFDWLRTLERYSASVGGTIPERHP